MTLKILQEEHFDIVTVLENSAKSQMVFNWEIATT